MAAQGRPLDDTASLQQTRQPPVISSVPEGNFCLTEYPTPCLRGMLICEGVRVAISPPSSRNADLPNSALRSSAARLRHFAAAASTAVAGSRGPSVAASVSDAAVMLQWAPLADQLAGGGVFRFGRLVIGIALRASGNDNARRRWPALAVLLISHRLYQCVDIFFRVAPLIHDRSPDLYRGAGVMISAVLRIDAVNAALAPTGQRQPVTCRFA